MNEISNEWKCRYGRVNVDLWSKRRGFRKSNVTGEEQTRSVHRNAYIGWTMNLIPKAMSKMQKSS